MVARSFLSASLLACLALGAVGCGAAEPEDEALGVVDDAEDALTMVWPVVRSGQVNQDVTTVQYLLKAAGFTVSLDGSYGAGTETAVKSFQRARGLVADGIVGTSTWAKLIATVSSGSRGGAVEAVQYLLKNRYAKAVSVSGTFDTNTVTQVKSFQQSRCLTADGVVGSLTWNALVGRTTNCGGGGTSGSSSSPSTPAASGGPASRILSAHRAGTVTLWNQTFGRYDGADPLNNITDAASGRPAKRSCYGSAPCGSVYLQSGMLNAVAALRERYGYRFFVTTIAGGSHSSGSYHYSGRAIDVDEVNGQRIYGNSTVADQFLSACRSLGAVEAFGPRNDPNGHWDHLHCAW
jgi:zinc D-Ala-D-Ala carboxypeptidase